MRAPTPSRGAAELLRRPTYPCDLPRRSRGRRGALLAAQTRNPRRGDAWGRRRNAHLPREQLDLQPSVPLAIVYGKTTQEQNVSTKGGDRLDHCERLRPFLRWPPTAPPMQVSTEPSRRRARCSMTLRRKGPLFTNELQIATYLTILRFSFQIGFP